MPSADDFAQIYPDSSGKKIKTFESNDTNDNTVETQGMVLANSSGVEIHPLTEETGQEILKMLISIDKKLAKQTGTLPG